MDDETRKCVQCGANFPVGDGEYWAQHYIPFPFTQKKVFGEPISGWRCQRCNNKGKIRFYFFLIFVAAIIVVAATKII